MNATVTSILTRFGGAAFSFISLCCGGGILDYALLRTGRYRCVGAWDIDARAREVYKANHGHEPGGDFTAIPPADFPAHDVLVAGFPCQSFSMAGKRAGFADPRGTLFFRILAIIAAHLPRAILFENVVGLLSHDGGRTFATVVRKLEALGYVVTHEVLDARAFGLPQKRRRVFIVALRRDLDVPFVFPAGTATPAPLADYLEADVPARYFVTARALAGFLKRKALNVAKGHGHGMVVIDPQGCANTLTASSGGRERNLVVDLAPAGAADRRDLRYLTPRECARLQGLPDTFALPVKDAPVYRILGNAVAVPVVEQVGRRLAAALDLATRRVPLRKSA